MERIIDLLLTLLPGSILLLQILVGKIMLANNLILSRNASEKAMAPHSSTLAWKIHGPRSLVGYSPWGHEESDTTERLRFHFSLFTFLHWRRKWQPTPVFLPGETQGRGSLVSCHPLSCTESDTTEVT